MQDFKTLPLALLLAGLVRGQKLTLTDSGLGTSCGTSICCIAECNVGLDTKYCSTSYVSFAGSCYNYQENPKKYVSDVIGEREREREACTKRMSSCRDVDDCDGWQICVSSTSLSFWLTVSSIPAFLPF